MHGFLHVLVHTSLLFSFAVSGSLGTNSISNNWAVLVGTSRYWHNYRHTADTLAIYHLIKRNGIPDSRILLLLADNVACNPRNPYPATPDPSIPSSIKADLSDIQVDYRGEDVTVEAFFSLLTGSHKPCVPLSKRLLSDVNSNVLVYMAGHGGDEFLKFHDKEDLLASELGDAIQNMWEAHRYRKMLLIVDTCQAATLYRLVSAPNVIAVASSLKGQNSYSRSVDPGYGLALGDQFTSLLTEFLAERPEASISRMLNYLKLAKMASTMHYMMTSGNATSLESPVSDFFGSLASVSEGLEPGSGAASRDGLEGGQWLSFEGQARGKGVGFEERRDGAKGEGQVEWMCGVGGFWDPVVQRYSGVDGVFLSGILVFMGAVLVASWRRQTNVT